MEREGRREGGRESEGWRERGGEREGGRDGGGRMNTIQDTLNPQSPQGTYVRVVDVHW